jgi:AcrR family transcriptional regulator
MTRTRLPVTRERVLKAALELADEGGVAAVSMRRVAEALGVKAMSLYNHVANKDDVLDGMVDATYAEIAAPTPGADWRAQVREIAISAHEVFLRHPWAATLQTSVKPGPGRLRYGDRLLGCFRDAGFSKQLTYHAYHIIESYVLGYTSLVLAYRAVDTDQFEDVAARFTRGDFAAEYPHFTEHALQHMEPEPGQEDVNAYELGLDMILAGLEDERTAEGHRTIK